MINCSEHQQLIDIIINNEPEKVTALWRESHWSFGAYEKFIRRFYFGSHKRIEAGLAWKE